LPAADTLRKGIGKKIPEVIEGLRKEFIEGAVKNGIPTDIAEEVFSLIDYFSGYGFNKSHSAAYALIAYQTAYLKAHYPVEFMSALLTNTSDLDKIASLINDCHRMGIKILPPDIIKSNIDFTIESGQIRFGLGAIKSLGDANLRQIITNRPYNDVYDLVYKAHLNKAVLETLIKSGCLSKFGTRKSLLDFLPTLTKIDSIVQKDDQTLFGTGEELLPEIPHTGEYSLEELLAFEKESLGFYVSSHPLDGYEIPDSQEIITVTEGRTKIAGIVTAVRSGIKYKKTWYYATVEDYSGRIGVLVFDKQIEIGQAYLFQGNTKLEEDNYKLFAYRAEKLRKKTA
jgi:DNA polymerase-3 subunit alpha